MLHGQTDKKIISQITTIFSIFNAWFPDSQCISPLFLAIAQHSLSYTLNEE